ncbi:MAG TPA: NADPH-dependent oxidoreductase [Gammaproteobacteria bacterium]|nr:NADPH-dependent oxidoreductase [Gammaproteobacteria bacterium]
MKITIISGSHREDSQSEKVARHIEKTLLDDKLCDEAWLLSLANNPLPLWEEKVWDKDPEWEARLNPIREQLKASEGFVIIAPEWHGQVPAGLKNFFLLFSRFELGHKPALIVTVSNGTGGSYPVAELRMSSYKNNRICYIPEQVIVRDVETVLNKHSVRNDAGADTYFRERIAWTLKMLVTYAEAMTPIRTSGVTDDDRFKNGM